MVNPSGSLLEYEEFPVTNHFVLYGNTRRFSTSLPRHSKVTKYFLLKKQNPFLKPRRLEEEEETPKATQLTSTQHNSPL